MDSDNELEEPNRQIQIQKPTDFFNKLVFLLADLIYNAMGFVIAPASTLLSLISESFQRAEETKHTVESAVRKSPSLVAQRVRVAVRRLSYGAVAAGMMCMVMVLLLVVAVGVSGLGIRYWLEEPVGVKEQLKFDYTEARPRALFGMGNNGNTMKMKKKKNLGIPVGHTFFVCVVLLMPESQFNREFGVFQLSAELISTNGNIITRSSQPCMLRFSSAPVRLARTILTSFPVLIGISTESQKLSFPILKHKEENEQRSAAIQVTISPRIGTSALPELYEAHILINSKLPKVKELLRRWRWTCFLWTSIYIYLMFLVMFMLFWKPVMFGAMRLTPELSGLDGDPRRRKVEADESLDEMAEITVELLRKWQERRRRRRRRKASMFGYGSGEEDVGSTSASSISCSRDYIGAVFEEDVGDSESVLLEGYEEYS